MTIESMPPNYRDQRLANILQKSADQLASIRIASAVPLGVALACDDGGSVLEESFLAGTIAGLYVSDKIDGNWSREAANLTDTKTTPEGAELDHKADKCLFYGVMGGLAIRAAHRGDYRQSVFLSGIFAANVVRDLAMARTRKYGHEYHVDTKARNLGKYKTGAYAIGASLLASPLSRSRKGRIAANAAIVAGTVLSGAALADMHLYVKNRIKKDPASLQL